MAFSSGVFTRLYSWAADKIANTKITASRMDAEMDGFATGLSSCILKDGTQTITAAIPWNSQSLTGVGVLTVTGSTASTSTSTGAAIVTGGLGVGGSVFANKFSGANQPCFSAHKNGSDQTGIADQTYTKLTFATEAFDIGSFYDAANSKWTPPAGLVQIIGRAYLSVVTNGICGIAVYKNGVLSKTALYNTDSTADGVEISIIDRANGSDYYELYVYGTAVTTATVSGAATSSFFMGFSL